MTEDVNGSHAIGCFTDLTDREIGIIQTTISLVYQWLEKFPAPSGVEGMTLNERDVEIMAQGYAAAPEILDGLLYGLIMKGVEESRSIDLMRDESNAQTVTE